MQFGKEAAVYYTQNALATHFILKKKYCTGPALKRAGSKAVPVILEETAKEGLEGINLVRAMPCALSSI
jgi:hypothetical protein